MDRIHLQPLSFVAMELKYSMLERPWDAIAVCLLATGIVLALATQALAANAGVVTRISSGGQMYWVEQVAEGLNFPSSMVWLPNGDMLITERMGGLRILRGGKLHKQPVSGTPQAYQSLYDGLKDILIDPDYEANKNIYLYISEGTFDQRHAAIYRARYSDSGLKNVVRIFVSKDRLGGHGMIVTRMIFLADDTLLVAVAGGRFENRAQQLDSHMGKILRINRDGSVPKDNPFFNTPGALPEIWTYGHRVPLGLYQEPKTHMILEVESGPRGGDEINVLKAGGNYGWARASWGFAYGSRAVAAAPLQSGRGMEDPILVWMPSATPSGLTRYRGKVYPEWNGNYFLGHLTTKALVRLQIEDHHVILQEKMLLDLEERIRDVKVGPDGHLYLLTDHQNGRVLRLQPGRPRENHIARVAASSTKFFSFQNAEFPAGGEEEIANMKPGDSSKGRQAFLERCSACHSVGAVIRGGEIGPDLAGVYGRLMGRKAGFGYSTNMAGSSLEWNFATLNKYLANPGGFVPGTTMASPPVADAIIRRYIIGFLRQQSPE